MIDNQFVDTAANASLNAGDFPGLVVHVSDGTAGGNVYQNPYGVSSLINRQNSPMRLDHKFRIASVSKMLTAHAVLKYIDAGTLHFNDTIGQYITGLPNGESITLRHLLCMRSGVNNYLGDAAIMLRIGGFQVASPYPHATLMAKIKSYASQFEPDSQYQYSNSNYVLLADVLQQITGKPYRQAIMDEVAIPLGMANTSFPSNAEMPKPNADGYAGLVAAGPGTRGFTRFHTDLTHAAAGIVSTIGDLAVYAQAFLDGALLSESLHEQRLTETEFASAYGDPDFPQVEGFDYGIGVSKFGEWIGHNGAIPGWCSALYVHPATGAQVILLGNRENVGPQINELMRLFFRLAEHVVPESL